MALGGEENVLSVERKTWDAYPVLEPLSADEFAPLRLDDGLYYTSPMGTCPSQFFPLLLNAAMMG